MSGFLDFFLKNLEDYEQNKKFGKLDFNHGDFGRGI